MNAALIDLLTLIAFTAILIRLGKSARNRRKEAALGDMFFDAVKDKKYCAIIAAMILTFLLALFYALQRKLF